MSFFQGSSRGIFRRDALLFILVSLFLVASETWLFKGDMILKKLEVSIRLIVPVLFIIFFRIFTVPQKGKVLFFLYGILPLYMLPMAFFSDNPALIALNTAKLLFLLSFPLTFLLILRPSNFSYRFLYIPAYLGLFLSIQTIILFLLIQTFNSPPSEIITLVAYNNMEVLSFGLWGYGHGMSAVGSDLQVYRAQSFFGEPTVFANFMETATILSYGIYKVKKDKKMLVISALCAISLFLAFSMTAYIVVFLTFCFYKIVLVWDKMGFLKPVVAVMSVSAVIITIFLYFYATTHPAFYGQSTIGFALGHGKDQIWVRIDAALNALRIFMEYPLGIGLVGHADSKILSNYHVVGTRFAPTGWMISAGIVGITTQITILFYLFRRIVIKYIGMSGRIERYIALSFVTCVIHQTIAGNWFTALFFYLVVCLVATDAYRFSFDDKHRSRYA